MKIKKYSRFNAEVSTSSMSDIMFFLMLFFLIISTMANPNVIRLLLPSAKTSQNIQVRPVALSITGDKQYFVDGMKVPFELLEETLITKVEGIENPTVVLQADKNLSIQDLVDVMQLGVKVKAKLVLATTKQSS